MIQFRQLSEITIIITIVIHNKNNNFTDSDSTNSANLEESFRCQITICTGESCCCLSAQVKAFFIQLLRTDHLRCYYGDCLVQHSKTGHLSFTSIRTQDTFKSNCNRPQTPHTVFPGNQPVDFSICTFTEIHTFGLIDGNSQIQDTFIKEPEEILYNNLFYPKQIELHLKIQKWCVFMQRRHRSSRDKTHQHDS